MLNDLYQSLDPVALDLGFFVIRWYSLAYLAGFVCAGIIMYRRSKRWSLSLSSDDIIMVICALAFGVILGGRLFYVLFYAPTYYLQNPLHVFMLSEGGMSFHGGLCGAILAGFLICRYLNFPFLRMADLVVCGAPLGLFFGRLANFVNGELWGKATDLPWAVSFISGGGIPRHPSQLYEAFLEGLLIFVVLAILSRKNPPYKKGFYLGVFLLLYGVFRFLVEFVRVPDEQLGYLFAFITMGQILSLPLIVAGLILLLYTSTKSSKKKRI